MKTIPLAKPQINWRERRAVSKVLKSSSLAQGPEVKALEKEFSKIVGERDCVAVNSGTSALHLSLIALGITENDEVIVPSFTFAATANVVALVGAKPIFVDIDPKTYCIDPVAVTKAITKNTKAIIVVHLYGLPANMNQIQQLANKHSLLVIEDAAQAHLAAINKQNVGTFGDAAAFSFYPTKNMTAGEGGMVVLKDLTKARVCRLLRNQGMETRYQNEIVGFNLRMTDIHAAIGRCQLKKLPKATEKRISNAKFLSDNLNSNSLPFIPEEYRHVFHQYTVRISHNRDTFSKLLKEKGVGNDVYYPTPVHKLPSFDSKIELFNTNTAAQEVLSLPVHPSLTKNQLRRIVDAFNRVQEEIGNV